MKSAGRLVHGPESEVVKWTVPVYPVAMFWNGSRSETVTLKADPAVALPGAERLNCVAAAGFTVTVPVPVMELVTESVAITFWLPAVTKVTPPENVCTPAAPATKG